VSFISFYRDEGGFRRYLVNDDRYVPLGVFLVMDVQSAPTLGLDLLEMVDDVVSGREEVRVWDGEGFLVRFSRSGVSMQNNFLEHQRGECTLEEVREAAESYWPFLAGIAGPEQVSKEFISWERTWERRHPYRGRFF